MVTRSPLALVNSNFYELPLTDALRAYPMDGNEQWLQKEIVTTNALTSKTISKRFTVLTGTAGASLALTLPAGSAASDGLEFIVMSVNRRTSVTWTSSGTTVSGAPTTLEAGLPIIVRYNNSDTTWYSNSYLVITASGDLTGSGTSSLPLTLVNSGVTAGTYTKVTVDAKGRVTVGANPTTLVGYGITDALNLAGGTMTGNIVMTAGSTVTGVPTPVGDTDAVPKIQLLTRAGASTALISGGQISMNIDTTKIDIASGVAQFLDYTDPLYPTVFKLAFGSQTVSLTSIATQNATYFAINSSGTIVQQGYAFAGAQRRTLVALGMAIHSDMLAVSSVLQTVGAARSTLNQMQDLIDAIGSLNINGNVYSANGANLSLNKTAGLIFKYGANFAVDSNDPSRLSIGAQTALTFRYRSQLSVEGADTTVINPTVWDNGGTITTLPGGKFTTQHIFLFANGMTRIQYGQTVYDSLLNALDAIGTEMFNIEPNIAINTVARGLLILRKETTSLLDTTKCAFIEISKFGSPSGTASNLALAASDIITALGFTPANIAGDTFTGSVVETAVGKSTSKSVVNTNGLTATTLSSQYTYLTGTAGLSLIITLPAAAAALDGAFYIVMSSVGRSLVSWASSGATFVGTPGSLTAGAPVKLHYNHATTQWFITS